jgi:hypothetical protein
MRKASYFLALGILAGAGCLSPMPPGLDEQATKAPPVKSAATTTVSPAAPPIVTADEVTEANAVEKAADLARELDYAANERPGASPAVKEVTTKP